MRLRLSSDAYDDLAEISEFGSTQWGEDVARAYTDELVLRLNRLIYHPESGPPEERIAGFRRLSFGRHIAYYRIERFDILIVRVLHASRDPVRHIS